MISSTNLSSVDLTEPIARYFHKQAEKVSGIVQDQTVTVADLATRQAEKVERVKLEQAKEAEEAEKAKAREAKRVEREEAKKAQEKAREAFEGLSKAELSDQLPDVDCPKTGNLEDLIERLASADSE